MGQLGERGVRVMEPQLEHLLERRGEKFWVEILEGPLLSGRSHRGAPRVGSVEVGDAVRVGLGLAENGPCLVLEYRLVEAHLGEEGRYAVGALRVGDPPPAP